MLATDVSPAFHAAFIAAGNTEGNPSLNLVYDASIPANNYTYRAYCNGWVGLPSYPPSFVVTLSNGQQVTYASWNGSTETTSWQVLSGRSPSTLSLVASAPKTDFETAIPVTSLGPYFQVQALNSLGQVIGVSKLVPLTRL